MTPEHHLVTPGPTPVPPDVAAAMAAPILHHRGPAFRALLDRLLPRLGEILCTANEVVLFTSSGTGAMEAAIANVCSPGDRVLVASAGYFGERWAALARAYGLEVVHLRSAWGKSLDADEIAGAVAEAGGVRAVYVTHSETSTGVVHDVRHIAEALRGANALLVVDAVSSLGAVPLETDAWGIDVVVSGSQKALMTPPGLALSSISSAARAAADTATLPRFSLDWRRVAALGSTPAITLVQGLDAAVSRILAEGLEAAFDRHARLGRACRAGARAMGLGLFSPDEDRSAVVTAIRIPDGVDGVAIVRAMRDRFGVTVVGGQGELKGRIVRIGHIGYIGLDDVRAALAALEGALAEAGADVEPGTAAAAAADAYAGARA